MNFNKFFQDTKPHLFVIIAFFLIGYVYFIKTFNGYTHHESDVTQGNLKTTEIVKYKNIDGEVPGWTNSVFSGMPTTLLYGKESSNNVAQYSYLTPFGFTAYPFKILFLSFIGFYLLMCAFKVKPTLAACAALAYGFATYSISSIEAAHYTKVMAMALMPALIASVHWLFNGRYLMGGALLAFNFALQIYYFHYQITFYSIICLLVMGVYYLIDGFRNGRIKPVLLATAISVLAIGAGVLSNTSKIKATSKFADNTMRGGNDMAKADNATKQKETGKTGLNRDYAFSYSYGIGESFTLLIPGFYGGSQAEKVSTSSAFYKQTQNDEAIEQGLPLYHGELDIISGPIYIGAIIIFLFVLGLIIIKESIKWPILILTLISFMLGWGGHFGILNDFLFDHLPYFNKFRTPMMAFCIAQVTMPLMGFLAIKELYDHWSKKVAKKISSKTVDSDEVPASKTIVTSAKNDEHIWKKVQLAFYIVGGFCLLMAFIGPSLIDMGGAIDKELNGDLVKILKEDRASLLRADSFRSFVFIAIAFGFLWAWYTNKIQKKIAVIFIGIFATIDLIGVDWRYLSWDDFKFEKGEVSERTEDAADKQILADKDLDYRVFDLSSGNPFTSNDGAAFHKLVGGYDPAKLSRYQDVIAELLSKNEYQNLALDMLNCKYLIVADSNNRIAVPRPTANGNAWFINQLIGTSDAKKEMDKLKTINVKTEATFNGDFKVNKELKGSSFEIDTLAIAKLVRYHPDTMSYVVKNSKDGFLVFSEIYYDDWKVTIDGQETKLNKVDYTLRGLKVPAGQHKIVCYFNKIDSTTDQIDFIASLIILIVLGLNIILWLKTYFVKS